MSETRPDAPPDRPTDAPRALAPHHLRLFALLADYLVLVAGLKLLNQLTLPEHWDLKGAAGWLADDPGLWAAALAALTLVKDGRGGRSLGKWLTGIAVRRAG